MCSWAHITKGTRHILSIIRPSILGRDAGYGTPNGPRHTVGIRVECARLFVFYVALICFVELLDISDHHREKKNQIKKHPDFSLRRVTRCVSHLPLRILVSKKANTRGKKTKILNSRRCAVRGRLGSINKQMEQKEGRGEPKKKKPYTARTHLLTPLSGNVVQASSVVAHRLSIRVSVRKGKKKKRSGRKVDLDGARRRNQIVAQH